MRTKSLDKTLNQRHI